jgi:hypothetical protein
MLLSLFKWQPILAQYLNSIIQTRHKLDLDVLRDRNSVESTHINQLSKL